MRSALLLSVALLVACDGGSEGNAPDTDTDGSGSSTATASSSSGGSTGGSSNPTATSMPPGTEPADSTDGDASSSSDGETSVGTTDTEGDTSGGQSEMGGGTIDVTLSGCDIDFGGTVVVSYNGSLGVASIYDMGATLSGSFQFDLDGPATMALSTQHRVDTGTVVNMVDVGQGTWTNMDADALSGGVDSIGGTLDVQVWNPARGQAEIVLDGVSLMNVVNGNVCTIDGTITAEELYP